MRLSALVLAASLASSSVALAAAPYQMVGITFGANDVGTLWDINPATAATSNPRVTGVQYAGDIVSDSTGKLYSFMAATDPSSVLYTIDRATGATTPIGNTGLSTFFEGGLTFNSAGTLYAGWSGPGGVGAGQLDTINTATGAGAVVGTMSGSSDVSALAFSSGGTLFALDDRISSNGLLYTLNPATGAILTTTTLDFVVGATAGMAFDPTSGTLYVASTTDGDLRTVNTSTGATAIVGSLSTLGTDVSGIAFVPVTPEPASLSMIAFASVSLIARRRRHCE